MATSTPAPVASEARKTFRLDGDIAQLIADRQSRYGTENKTLNELLRNLVKLEKKDAQAQIFAGSQLANIADANAVAQQWKEKHDAKAAELATLQNALRLVGQFLKPVDL